MKLCMVRDGVFFEKKNETIELTNSKRFVLKEFFIDVIEKNLCAIKI